MKKEEIERIKQGVAHALSKNPGNVILRDLERAILTVERFRGALDDLSTLQSSDPAEYRQRAAQALLY